MRALFKQLSYHLAAIVLILTTSCQQKQKTTAEIFVEEQSGVCLVLNACYYETHLPTGKVWYCSGIDDEGDLEKFILAGMLLLCLAPLPYGYYQLVRFVTMVAFVIFAFDYYKANKTELAIVCGGVALLFQPFIKIALGRALWNVVDVVIAVALIIVALTEREKKGT